jgi:hypothetical protein
MLIRYLAEVRSNNWGLEILRQIEYYSRELGERGRGVFEFLERNTPDLENDRLLKFLRAVMAHCFDYRHLPGIGPIIKGVADDLVRLHGCYISPELVAFLKEKGVFEKIMEKHGLYKNAYLIGEACIFIYPAVLHKSYNVKMERFGMNIPPSDRTACFHEFMNHTIVHEHAHALHRHGVSKVYFNQKKLDYMTEVKALSEKRWDYDWIEEGFAEETTFLYYYLKVYENDEGNPIRQFLLRAMDEHTDAIRDVEIWPYYGRRSIEKKLGVSLKSGYPGKIVYDVPPNVYSGEKKSYYILISTWKMDPLKLASHI